MKKTIFLGLLAIAAFFGAASSADAAGSMYYAQPTYYNYQYQNTYSLQNQAWQEIVRALGRKDTNLQYAIQSYVTGNYAQVFYYLGGSSRSYNYGYYYDYNDYYSNDNDRQDAKDAINDAKDAIEDAEDAIHDARRDDDSDDDDIDDAEDFLDDAYDYLDDAEDVYDDGDYDRAVDKARDAEDAADDAIDEL